MTEENKIEVQHCSYCEDPFSCSGIEEPDYEAVRKETAKSILDELQEGYDNWESMYSVYLRLRKKFGGNRD